MTRRFPALIGLLTGWVGATPPAVADEPAPPLAIVAVVRADSPLRTLSRDEIIAVYTGRAVNGATPLDYAGDNPIRDRFYERVAGRSGRQMRSFWIQHVFSGAGRGPTYVKDVAEMQRLLAEDGRAVGYLPATDIPAGLKVIWALDPGDGP